MPTLAELITQQKQRNGASYRTLEDRAGSVISAQRWQQLGTGTRINEFPEPATLQAIADALQVDIATVVLAAARSIGLKVRRRSESDLAAMLPASAARLTGEQRDAILALVRAITREESSNASQPADPAATEESGAPREATEDEKTGDNVSPLIRADQGAKPDQRQRRAARKVRGQTEVERQHDAQDRDAEAPDEGGEVD